MQACVLIKFAKSKDFHPSYEKICQIKGVIKADEVFGPWDVVAKIEGDTRGELSKVRDGIIHSGDIREVLTMIIYPE